MKHSQTISVISEYKKLGLDFVQLLEDSILLGQLLTEADNYEKEKQKELEATQFCYNLNPIADYKTFYDEASMENLKAKYRVKMLKIIHLLSQKYDTVDECIEKREKLLELVEFRKKTISKIMDVRMLFDPFDRVRIKEQLEVIISFVDNSKIINRMRKEISDLNFRTEEMLRENNNYLITLSNTKALIENRVGFKNVDTIPFTDTFEEMSVSSHPQSNQVIAVRGVSKKLNMLIVIQKANGVLGRVNRLMSQTVVKKDETSSSMFNPELVIVPATSMEITNTIGNVDDVIDEVNEDNKINMYEIDSNLFETVLPFSEPIMFSDRTDDVESSQSLKPSDSSEIIEFPKMEDGTSNVIDFSSLENGSVTVAVDEEDSNDFWPSQVYSDEQIGKILSLNDMNDIKVRRKAA